MGFKVGVSTGMYYIAHTPDLATPVRKIGYALTRGTSAIEISGEQPHEVIETEGKDIRYIAEKQGLDILFHGSLTVPMCSPERGEWRDAQDHIQKSIRSAVLSGSKYVNFHGCLHYWLELMTYAGRKLTMVFCDHDGRFISELLKEDKRLRTWFTETRGINPYLYLRDILDRDETSDLENIISERVDKFRKDLMNRDVRSFLESKKLETELIEHILDVVALRNVCPSLGNPILEKEVEKIIENVRQISHRETVKIQREETYKYVWAKLERGGKWDTEELRGGLGVIDGYHIVAHHLYYKKDRIWKEMVEVYKDVIDKYKTVTFKVPGENKEREFSYPDDLYWLDGAWQKAEKTNDRTFKEFYYSVVASKFLEGHMRESLKWIKEELIEKELKGKPELQEIARKLNITIETPDARDATYAGLYLLWKPKQIYVAIKVLRESLKTDKIWMLMDYEHVATQGVDAINEMKHTIVIAPDFGKYVLSVHSNFPSPLHSHVPLELGDTVVYRLLLMLAKTGFGENKEVYLIYERGGGDDPFQRSIDTLKLMVPYLEDKVEVEKLPMKFFGLEEMAGDVKRQEQIIRDHRFEPLKDLFEHPEEEWGTLSAAAKAKGKAEAFKKGEMR